MCRCNWLSRIGGVAALSTATALSAGPPPADAVYRHGYVYTVDAHNAVAQAVAVRAGRLVYVGNDRGVATYIGPHTDVRDLGGRMLMPGLIDGHMHPLAGGASLVKCNLRYERLDVAGLQARVQACLDASGDREPDDWLEVGNWFQEGMQGDARPSRAALDAIDTRRPIMVFSSFGHTALVNSRALALAHIDATTIDPKGGVIERDAQGQPTGILQDAAFEPIFALIPKATPEQNATAALAALDALRRQGVTTALDAAADSETIAAFAAAKHAGRLTARMHFAVHIRPPEAADPQEAVARARALAERFDSGAIRAEPGLTVRNIKLFLDGVITAPAQTGAMLEPYFEDRGAKARPQWAAGKNRGPDVYFAPTDLARLLTMAADAGFEPHMHADGDRAVRAGLDAIATLRRTHPAAEIRAAIAHDEMVDPADFARFRALGAIPVLSFQWEKPAPDTVEGARDYLGPSRYRYMEPAGVLAQQGARIAFGSDWPVDPLDEWFALKVSVTRTNAPAAGQQYSDRLGHDPGLTRRQALRAATVNAAYELHQDAATGSIEVGKLADFIVLDRNVLMIPAEDIADVRVLYTVVGGRVVYDAASP